MRNPTRTLPTTVADLLKFLPPFGAAVEDCELVFAIDPPPELEAVLAVLHTGIRATLTGRTWYGCGTDRKSAAAKQLDPCAPIPPGVWLLAVEGDERWDRIHPAALLDLPKLFTPGS